MIELRKSRAMSGVPLFSRRSAMIVPTATQRFSRHSLDGAYPVAFTSCFAYSLWPVFNCPLMAGFGCPPRSGSLAKSSFVDF